MAAPWRLPNGNASEHSSSTVGVRGRVAQRLSGVPAALRSSRAPYPSASSEADGRTDHRFPGPPGGYGVAMFLFFSNRLGCFGSIVLSVVLTVILLLILGVIGGGGR